METANQLFKRFGGRAYPYSDINYMELPQFKKAFAKRNEEILKVIDKMMINLNKDKCDILRLLKIAIEME